MIGQAIMIMFRLCRGAKGEKANLDLLRERAVAYAAGSYSSLFDFMRYIEQLKKNQIDFGEAVMPENDKGRVRIMSIHKSKGLEYPIVIFGLDWAKNLIFRTASASWLCMQRAASGWMRSIFRPAKR